MTGQGRQDAVDGLLDASALALRREIGEQIADQGVHVGLSQ